MSTIKGTFTLRQLRFMEEFMCSGDRISSAITAGFSKSCAPTMASRLLARKDVQEFITNLKKEAATRILISEEGVVSELASLAFTNTTDFYDDDGKLLPLKDIPKQAQKAIETIEIMQLPNGTIASRIKAHPKLASLKLLGDYLGMFDREENKNATLSDIKVEINISE